MCFLKQYNFRFKINLTSYIHFILIDIEFFDCFQDNNFYLLRLRELVVRAICELSNRSLPRNACYRADVIISLESRCTPLSADSQACILHMCTARSRTVSTYRIDAHVRKSELLRVCIHEERKRKRERARHIIPHGLGLIERCQFISCTHRVCTYSIRVPTPLPFDCQARLGDANETKRYPEMVL